MAKALQADAALPWLLSSMDQHVVLKQLVGDERFVAYVACEGLYTQMVAFYVSFEAIFALKDFFTVVVVTWELINIWQLHLNFI